jgi:transposase
MKISPQERLEVKRKYQEDDLSIKEIAEHYDVTPQTIKNILKSFRFNLKKNPSNNTKITKEASTSIAKAYKKNKSAKTIKDLAEEFDVTTATIRNVLKKEKVYQSTNKPHVSLEDAQKDQVIKKYLEGVSGRKIAEEFNISYQHVYDILKNNDVKRRKLTDYERTQKIPPSEHKKIVERYKAGISSKILSQEYNVSVALIFKILGNFNIETRNVQIIGHEEYDTIVDMYVNQNMSTYKIGKEYNVHANTIYAILKKLKVKLRPKWYKKITPNKYPRIIERYKRGDAVDKIAKDYGVTPNSIKYIIEKLHITKEAARKK